MAIVGPGVKPLGRDDRIFSDHVDVRPTLVMLTGLKDDYIHDGRVMVERLHEQALPNGIRQKRENYLELATLYKDLNATLGSVGRNSLRYANRSITSNDGAYAQYLTTIGAITTKRDALASSIKTALNGAAFGNQPVAESQEDGQRGAPPHRSGRGSGRRSPPRRPPLIASALNLGPPALPVGFALSAPRPSSISSVRHRLEPACAKLISAGLRPPQTRFVAVWRARTDAPDRG